MELDLVGTRKDLGRVLINDVRNIRFQESDIARKNSFIASATSDNLSQGERFYLGAVVLWRCLSPPDKLAAFI
jgi:hypothetical protein